MEAMIDEEIEDLHAGVECAACQIEIAPGEGISSPSGSIHKACEGAIPDADW